MSLKQTSDDPAGARDIKGLHMQPSQPHRQQRTPWLIAVLLAKIHAALHPRNSPHHPKCIRAWDYSIS